MWFFSQLKETIQPKKTILSSFTHPQVVINMYGFVSSDENVGNQTVDDSHLVS